MFARVGQFFSNLFGNDTITTPEQYKEHRDLLTVTETQLQVEVETIESLERTIQQYDVKIEQYKDKQKMLQDARDKFLLDYETNAFSTPETKEKAKKVLFDELPHQINIIGSKIQELQVRNNELRRKCEEMKKTRDKTNDNAEILRHRIQDYQSHASNIEMQSQDHTVTLEDLENPNISNPPTISLEHLKITPVPQQSTSRIVEQNIKEEQEDNESDEEDTPTHVNQEEQKFIQQDPNENFEISDDSDDETHLKQEKQTSNVQQ